MYAFKAKTLFIDLSTKNFKIQSRDASFCKKFIGGSLLAAKLFEENAPKTNNPFSKDNPIVFATGPLAGESICGVTRVNVLSLSPETAGIYLSQSGGEFGPNLKRAGFDALIITGKASKPVFIKIDHSSIEFIDAKDLWNQDRLITNSLINKKLDKKYITATIGPAGENLVRHANIMYEPDHYSGRGGLGAVMGSKNLKAICVYGDHQVNLKDKATVKEINKNGAKRLKNPDPCSFLGTLKNLGTYGLLALNQDSGNLPTQNFKRSHANPQEFDYHMSHKAAKEKIVGKAVPCKACYLACKRQSKINPDYTALAEYESIALLGPNIGLEKDLTDGLKANEICNRLGMDTMSTGNMISYLMDCFEKRLIDSKKYGFSIKFGDGKKACGLIEEIGYRKSPLGNLLAEGIESTVKELGEKTRPFLRFSKGIGIPAHMPRKKPGIGFGYLHGPNPADHMKLEHDWIASDPDSLKSFELNVSSPPEALDLKKVEIAKTTQIYYSTMDTLSLCMFIFGPGNIYTFDEIVKMINAATGFEYTLKELMLAGERAIQLQRKLYMKYGGSDEDFLEYLESPIPEGPAKGMKISKDDFEKARKHHYKIWGWDENGIPTKETLKNVEI